MTYISARTTFLPENYCANNWYLSSKKDPTSDLNLGQFLKLPKKRTWCINFQGDMCELICQWVNLHLAIWHCDFADRSRTQVRPCWVNRSQTVSQTSGENIDLSKGFESDISKCSCKIFHALRYIPPSVAATSMRLPVGIIHHSIRFPTWMPERISGFRAKRIQRQPRKALSLHTFFMPEFRSPLGRWSCNDLLVCF